jgi:hypothetical protein
MVDFVFVSESLRKMKGRLPQKRGAADTDSEGAHSVVGRDVGASRLRRGIRSQHLPGTLLSQQREGITRVRRFPSRGGGRCLLGRWPGDDKHSGEPADRVLFKQVPRRCLSGSSPCREEGEEVLMRFMIMCRVPMEKGDELAKAGSLHSTIQSIMEELKPEAAYFSDIEGGRVGYIVVNMDDASQIAAIVEPLFLGLGAAIQVHPVMTPEELGRAIPAIKQASQEEYG